MSRVDSALGSSAIRYAYKRSTNPPQTRRQSIKFEIELPMNMSCSNLTDSDSEYESDYEPVQFTRRNSARRSVQIHKQSRHASSLNESNNQTICFKISIDNTMGSQRKASRPVEKAFSVSSGAASSGYASAVSNYTGNESNNNNAFCSNHSLNSYHSKPQSQSSYKAENVYDKLSYSNMSKRRYSLASVSSSADSNQSESDIYEEITNFTQREVGKHNAVVQERVSSPKAHTYCNEPVHKVARRTGLYRPREYTVNEIFQHARGFKEEASKREEEYVAAVSKSARSVNILKQLFEGKRSKQASAEQKPPVAKSRRVEPAAEMGTTAVSVSQHIYVNEKISSAIIV
jgi:hypothetical protein